MSFFEELNKQFPSDQIALDEERRKIFGKDWTPFFTPNPIAVFFPKNTNDVSQVLKLCHKWGQHVVPSGGRTGLASGAVAHKQELVLSLDRMNKIGEIDLSAQTIRVEAGVVLEALNESLSDTGLFWPLDLSSKGSCQIGGNISTNAGGLRFIRYGGARNWVQSLEVVTMQGEVMELNGNLEKNNSGYDLRHLMIGSEGTLAVVTGATLKLTQKPKEKSVFLAGVNDISSALKILRDFEKQGFVFQAFEIFSEDCFKIVKKFSHVQTLNPSPWYLLMETEGIPNGIEFEDIPGSTFALMAQNASEERRFWEYREKITESLSQEGYIYKSDVSIPLNELQSFSEQIRKQKIYGECSVFLFGHVADGNIHVNVLKPDHMEKKVFDQKMSDASQALYKMIAQLGGSLSAEHGIGLVKKPFLPITVPQNQIRIMKSIKTLWDPKNLLNPGKIFDS